VFRTGGNVSGWLAAICLLDCGVFIQRTHSLDELGGVASAGGLLCSIISIIPRLFFVTYISFLGEKSMIGCSD